MRAAQIKGRGGQSYLGPYTRGRNRKSLFKCPRWSYLCPRPVNIIYGYRGRDWGGMVMVGAVTAIG